MEVSIVLARIIGVYGIVAGLALIKNKALYADAVKRFRKKPETVSLLSFTTLLVGLVLLTLHRAWRADWTVIITLIGWLTVAKGVINVVFPDIAVSIMKGFKKTDAWFTLGGLLWMGIGAVLLYQGFFA